MKTFKATDQNSIFFAMALKILPTKFSEVALSHDFLGSCNVHMILDIVEFCESASAVNNFLFYKKILFLAVLFK